MRTTQAVMRLTGITGLLTVIAFPTLLLLSAPANAATETLFVHRVTAYSLEQIKNGAFCLNPEVSPPRIVDDPVALFPNGDWFNYEWVVARWGKPHHLSKEELTGRQGRIVRRVSANYEGVRVTTPEEDPYCIQWNGAYASSADGRVCAVGGTRHSREYELLNTLSPETFHFGLIPLFGTYGDLVSVLGAPQYISPIIGDMMMVEWFYLIGSRPNRMAVDIVANVFLDRGGIAHYVSVNIAHETLDKSGWIPWSGEF